MARRTTRNSSDSTKMSDIPATATSPPTFFPLATLTALQAVDDTPIVEMPFFPPANR